MIAWAVSDVHTWNKEPVSTPNSSTSFLSGLKAIHVAVPEGTVKDGMNILTMEKGNEEKEE